LHWPATATVSLESVEAGDVVPLARQEHEADQIAERIDDHRDLCRQAMA